MVATPMTPNPAYDNQLPLKLTVTDQANNPIVGWNYEWYKPDNTAFSTATDAIVYDLEGLYTVKIAQINQPTNYCMVSGLVGNTTIHDKLDHSLFYLDKAPITTKFLIDRVTQTAELMTFGNVGNNTSSNDHFNSAYKELFEASYDNPDWYDPKILVGVARKYKTANLVSPISVINVNFNYLDELAVTDNLVEIINGRVIDKPNRSRSPYLTREVLVVSVLGDKGYKRGLNKFLFPRSLYFENTIKTITTLSIDFANGAGPVTVLPDQIVNVNYTTLGKKTLNIVVNFSDGTSKSTMDDIIPEEDMYEIPRGLDAAKFIDEPIKADLGGFVPYNTTGADETPDAYPDVPGEGDLRFYYDKNIVAGTKIADFDIKNPVIILDGFDHNDKRTQTKLYSGQFQYVKNVAPSPTTNIVENLVAAGYQVFVLNFPTYKIGDQFILDRNRQPSSIDVDRDGGADYIERNAMVLVKLIQEINKRIRDLNKTDKISIIGPSMGGLISRYALTYMEQRNLNPNTKLWVSFDSPHHGANINIGDQLFFKYISGLTKRPEAQDGIETLKSVAAKQLMIHHYSKVAYPKVGDDPRVISGHLFHDTFFNTINAMGFPQTTCNVALINGRLDGSLQENAPGNCGTSLNVIYEIKYTIFTYNRKILLKLPINTTMVAKISPSNRDICNVFSIGNGLYPDPWVNNHLSYNVIGNGRATSLDILPGGYNQVNNELPPEMRSGSIFLNQCFIPTVSSIALKDKTGDWGRNLTGINIAIDTPFKDIYDAKTANEDHVFITPGAVTFIRNKLLAPTCN